ncbi:MAG: TIM barrel protein [Pseudomonadota bacterium]
MTRFSANLGFLFPEHALSDAIRAAGAHGFDAVECHWPYDVPPGDVKAALDETGLPMLGLNTVRGNPGENGLAALPGREDEARAAIDQAIAYAAATGTANVHVMAGFAEGEAAHQTFVANLSYAANAGAQAGVGILIEPLNHYDAPGYFLSTTEQAAAIRIEAGVDNIGLMFDCYHVQLMEGDLMNRLRRLQPIIGHIQFAAVPDRGAPDHGEVAYGEVFRFLRDLGWEQPLGAEYKPAGETAASLGWMQDLR